MDPIEARDMISFIEVVEVGYDINTTTQLPSRIANIHW
jgi:hypothetical protein